jgi:hypothetical protein
MVAKTIEALLRMILLPGRGKKRECVILQFVPAL